MVMVEIVNEDGVVVARLAIAESSFEDLADYVEGFGHRLRRR